MKIIYISLLNCFSTLSLYVQNILTITTQKSKPLSVKVKHAEPIYIDLIRDLDARKGEAEFNFGHSLANYKNKKPQTFLFEVFHTYEKNNYFTSS